MEDPTQINDDLVLASFQAGDASAYKNIYDRYWQILFRHARKMLQNDDAAKDVVQEVFTDFWLSQQKKTINPPLAAYLFTLTRNKVLNLVKHSKVEAKYLATINEVINSLAELPDHQYIEQELYLRIEAEIQKLPPKMKAVFELSRKEYKTHKEIAERLNISDKTVKKQISNAIKILKSKMGDSINIFLTFF